MQEQVPAIIHKLSLEWVMRHQADECLSPASLTNTLQSDDAHPSPQTYPFSLDADDALYPKFSDVSLARLAELEDSQRTLSPFTAAISQSVFRSSVGLIASLRPRRKDFPFIKSSLDTDPAFPRPTEISPPESVVSAQSNVSRPSLFNARQRPAYLRRPRPPKRKVIRLGESSPSTSVQDHESVGQSETSEGAEDYFSEPNRYQNSYQRECESKWMKETVLREALWSSTYPKSWEGMASDHLEKGGEHPWTVGDSRYNGSRDKGGL